MNKVNCTYWSSCNVKGGGCCAHPDQPHGERPSLGVCSKVCRRREPVDPDAPATPPQKPDAGTTDAPPKRHICDDAPNYGPGTELHQIVGREAVKGCNCRWWICQMDKWGVEGCIQHREEIIEALMDGAKGFGKWFEKAAAEHAEPLARKHIGKIVDAAIENARKHEDGQDGQQNSMAEAPRA